MARSGVPYEQFADEEPPTESIYAWHSALEEPREAPQSVRLEYRAKRCVSTILPLVEKRRAEKWAFFDLACPPASDAAARSGDLRHELYQLILLTPEGRWELERQLARKGVRFYYRKGCREELVVRFHWGERLLGESCLCWL